MSKIIKIFVAIDAEKILQDHKPNGSQPVQLKNDGKGYAFLLTNWADADQYKYTTTYAYYGANLQDQEEGGYALNVKADVNDVIEWRAVSLTSPLHYQCYLSSLEPSGSWSNISQPAPKSKSVTCARMIPTGVRSVSVNTVQKNDYWWESTVTSTNRQAYNLLYTIVDNNGSNRGIFTHDPYIT